MTAKSALAKKAQKWIDEAEADKRLHELWQRDFYKYCLPHRRRPGDTMQEQPIHDQDELFDSTAIEMLASFAADMQSRFTPPAKDWLTVGVSQKVPVQFKSQVDAQMAVYQANVFGELRRSNFNEAVQEAYPDFGAGTAALCIQDYDINQPLQCQAISITDLLICRGMYGGLDLKARCLSPKYSQLKELYPNAQFPSELLTKINKGDMSRAKVRECWWRLYDQPGVERWQYVLLVDGHEAESKIFKGEGSCSIIVARWRTDSTTAWGVGPVYTILPTIKTLDQLAYLTLKYLGRVVDPVLFGPEDINLDQGIVPGTYVPVADGRKIEALESKQGIDAAFFERSMMQDEIKRAFFQNKPEQQGKTPPTASQWLDENAQIDKRMGAPVGRLVSEWQIPVFARVAYLQAQRGKLPPVQISNEAIKVEPQSPLIRSQRHEEVVVADNLLTMATNHFGPEQSAILIDGRATLENIQTNLEDKIVVLRSSEDIQKMTQMAAQAAQAMQQQQQAPA